MYNLVIRDSPIRENLHSKSSLEVKKVVYELKEGRTAKIILDLFRATQGRLIFHVVMFACYNSISVVVIPRLEK